MSPRFFPRPRLGVLLLLIMPAPLLSFATISAQPLDRSGILERLDQFGQVTLQRSGVVIEVFDYESQGDSVEALLFHPVSEGAYPGLFLIPGYSRSARDYLPLGVRFAKDGFAALAVTQPGFGRSGGEPDFVGPRTISALEDGLDRFRSRSCVDSTCLSIFGYSRGAMAASLIAVDRKDLAAAVFAAGIYDMGRAYETIGLEGIRENMEAEAGTTEVAFAERSSLPRMEALSTPVLILHGEQDENAPVEQAHLLADRLTELGKEFEIQVVPDRDHNLGMKFLYGETLGFLCRYCRATGCAGTR